MDTVLDVKQQIRSLVGDVDGDFCTDAYLMPLMNTAYKQALNILEGTCSPFITQLQVATNVPLGTSSLAELQKPGQPFDGLVNPLDVEVKGAGLPEMSYVMGKRKDILPNSTNYSLNQPTNYWSGRFCWEWRSYVVYITALGYAFDIRIRGEYRPPALVKDTDLIQLHPLMGVALGYMTAALVGAERGNANYVANYGQQGKDTLDDVSAMLVRQQQGTSSRVGRMNGRSGRRGGGNGGWF
jgi:hypothetical protein